MDVPPDILLIEDSPSQALRFQLALQRAGYTTDVVYDGAEGWRHAHAIHPRLILLDIDLPTMNGFQVLARLKRSPATRSIPVVMLTHREHVSHVLQALDLGADGYLPKQDALDRIADLIEQHLAPAPPESPADP